MRYLEEILFQHFALLKENVETMGLLDTAFALSFKILYLDRRLSDYPKLQPPPCNCYVTFPRTLWKILRSFQRWTNFIAQRHQLRKRIGKNDWLRFRFSKNRNVWRSRFYDNFNKTIYSIIKHALELSIVIYTVNIFHVHFQFQLERFGIDYDNY